MDHLGDISSHQGFLGGVAEHLGADEIYIENRAGFIAEQGDVGRHLHHQPVLSFGFCGHFYRVLRRQIGLFGHFVSLTLVNRWQGGFPASAG